MYTDSHCHITCDRLYSRIDEIIENIKIKNVTFGAGQMSDSGKTQVIGDDNCKQWQF